jgi:hypothetical protein
MRARKHEVAKDVPDQASVIQLFLEIGASERHFNTIEATYKGLASSWLFASFTAIGFVLSREQLPLHLNPELLGCAIAVLGIVGITLLWIIDVLVYHQLLDSWFKQGILLEKQNPWMIPVRTNMLQSTKGKGVLPRVVWFYIAADLSLIIVAAILLGTWASKYGIYALIGSVVISLLVATALVLFMKKATPTFESE